MAGNLYFNALMLSCAVPVFCFPAMLAYRPPTLDRTLTILLFAIPLLVAGIWLFALLWDPQRSPSALHITSAWAKRVPTVLAALFFLVGGLCFWRSVGARSWTTAFLTLNAWGLLLGYLLAVAVVENRWS